MKKNLTHLEWIDANPWFETAARQYGLGRKEKTIKRVIHSPFDKATGHGRSAHVKVYKADLGLKAQARKYRQGRGLVFQKRKEVKWYED